MSSECPSSLATWVTLAFSGAAVFISILAYRHSKENFRLNLLEKRWEVYEKVLKFCSGVLRFGGIPAARDSSKERQEEIIKILQDAEGAFRGIGYHKIKALFGPDIHQKMAELNKAYSFLLSGSKDIEREHKYLIFISEIANELPDLFKPYVYFGDFKKTSWREKVTK